MTCSLPEELLKTATKEVVESLVEHLGDSATGNTESFQGKADELLRDRIDLIIAENEGFEKRLAQAAIQSHTDALRAGHLKGLKHQLKIRPGGVSGKTAKQIIEHLFG